MWNMITGNSTVQDNRCVLTLGEAGIEQQANEDCADVVCSSEDGQVQVTE